MNTTCQHVQRQSFSRTSLRVPLPITARRRRNTSSCPKKKKNVNTVDFGRHNVNPQVDDQGIVSLHFVNLQRGVFPGFTLFLERLVTPPLNKSVRMTLWPRKLKIQVPSKHSSFSVIISHHHSSRAKSIFVEILVRILDSLFFGGRKGASVE